MKPVPQTPRPIRSSQTKAVEIIDTAATWLAKAWNSSKFPDRDLNCGLLGPKAATIELQHFPMNRPTL